MKFSSLLFCASLLMIMLSQGCTHIETPVKTVPKAIQGKIDLSNWNFEQNGIVKLNGEWEFYWEQLLEPQDFIGENNPEKQDF